MPPSKACPKKQDNLRNNLRALIRDHGTEDVNGIARKINVFLTLVTTGPNPPAATRFYISHLTPDNVNLLSTIHCKRPIPESDLEYEDVAASRVTAVASPVVTASPAITISPVSLIQITSLVSLASVSSAINMDNDVENDDPVQQFVNNIHYEKMAMRPKLIDAFNSLDTAQLREITSINAITAIEEDIIRCDRMENDTTYPNLLLCHAYIRIYQIMQRFRITVTAYLHTRYPNQTISSALFENKRQALYRQIKQVQWM